MISRKIKQIKQIIRSIDNDRLATFFGAGAALAQLLGATHIISNDNSLLASGIFSIGWAWVTNKDLTPSMFVRKTKDI